MEKPELKKLLNAMGQALYDKKGMNILALDVRGVSPITNYLIIATANVGRHSVALADEVERATTKMGIKPYLVNGLDTGEWVILDFIDVMVHIFLEDKRLTYRLEELWSKGKVIDLEITQSPELVLPV